MCLEEYGEAHRSLRNDWSDWCMFGLEDQRWEERNSNVQILKELSVQDQVEIMTQRKRAACRGKLLQRDREPSFPREEKPHAQGCCGRNGWDQIREPRDQTRLWVPSPVKSINSPEFYTWSVDHQEGRVSEWGLWIQKELDSGLAMGKGTAHSRPHSHPCKRTMREQFDPLTLTPWGSNKMMYIKCHWVSTRSLVRYQYMLASGNIKYASFYLAYSNWFR